MGCYRPILSELTATTIAFFLHLLSAYRMHTSSRAATRPPLGECKTAALLDSWAMMSPSPPHALPLPTGIFNKPYRTPQALLAHLVGCGLNAPNCAEAEAKLELIGYHRLRIYFLARRKKLPGKPFEPNVTFNDIIQLYEFDAKLRQICLEPCGTFEVLFRNACAELLSRRYGSHPYDDLDIFSSAQSRIDCLKSFSFYYSTSKDDRAKHYIANYKNPVLPSIWTMKELLTFGQAATFFRALSVPVKTAISNNFGVSELQIFDTWISCVVDLRNICAHHARLFNRSLQKQPGRLIRASVPTATSNDGKNKVKAILECIDYMIRQRGLPSTLVQDASRLVQNYPQVRPQEVGF